MDDLEAMDVAAWALDERLRLVSTDRFQEQSTCEGWSIYDLVNHVNGGGHRYLMLLQGADAQALSSTRKQDHVRSDAAGCFWRWQKPLAEEFATEGALARVVHHPVGDRSGRELLGMRILDLVLHAWDLARSLGADERIDPELARYVLTHQMHLVEELRGCGLYASEPDIVLSSDPQRELLSRTGRG